MQNTIAQRPIHQRDNQKKEQQNSSHSLYILNFYWVMIRMGTVLLRTDRLHDLTMNLPDRFFYITRK